MNLCLLQNSDIRVKSAKRLVKEKLYKTWLDQILGRWYKIAPHQYKLKKVWWKLQKGLFLTVVYFDQSCCLFLPENSCSTDNLLVKIELFVIFASFCQMYAKGQKAKGKHIYFSHLLVTKTSPLFKFDATQPYFMAYCLESLPQPLSNWKFNWRLRDLNPGPSEYQEWINHCHLFIWSLLVQSIIYI